MSEEILQTLDQERGPINSVTLAQKLGKDHQTIVGYLKSLQCYDGIIEATQENNKELRLTDEGQNFVTTGSYEACVFNRIPAEGIAQAELMKAIPNAKIGFSKAMQAGWIELDKSAATGPVVKRKCDSIEDRVQTLLIDIQKLSLDRLTDKDKNDFKKRKLITEAKVMSYSVSKGPYFTLKLVKPVTELTPEMIADGSWKTKRFKPLNFDAMGVMPASGYLHPLLKVRAEYRQIFLEMGFSEMATNNYVESSFWNFDALFQPQQHPARDAHDTFFLSDPAQSENFPSDYLERVKLVHSEGGFGSQGYNYNWKLEEAKKNILRTHTTAVSARMLYKIGQMEEFRPVKYFSIDRVFRNEQLDMTHLAEFHQIEGMVADRGLTLGHLMGIINKFFNKLGIRKLRFKPAYNPYTEPSMEVFSYHEGLRKWVEVGNSGIFRPEMLLPMGLPEDVVVIAWGLSLERPTMIKYGIDNIRDLIGPKVNLSVIQENPICRLDK